ncbi:MAG: GNAT family N-acetyltransferase [Planctomycetota bacterium]
MPLQPSSDATLLIHTARLELEPILPVHATEMFPVLNDPALHTFTGGSPPATVEQLAQRYTKLASRRSPDGSELWYNWLMRDQTQRVAIGYMQSTVTSTHAYIAWVVGTAWQGQKFAAEAAQAVVTWLEAQGVSEIRACVNPRHASSQGVARRAGLLRTNQLNDGEEVWVRKP